MLSQTKDKDPSFFLPRPLIKWLDSLDLAYSIRNPRRDLANGFIIAEILARRYPTEINIYTIYNGLQTDQKRDNWELISKLLSKKEFPLKKEEYEQIYNYVPDVAYRFLIRLYEFLNRRKLPGIVTKPGKNTEQPTKEATLNANSNNIKKLEIILNESKRNRENLPGYAKPTAALLTRDRELTRIIDNREKFSKTTQILEEHYQKNRNEKQSSNILEYILNKKKIQLEEELKKQSLMSDQKKKEESEFNPPEIKEIPVKSFNTHTNKKKELQQAPAEGRETQEFFSKVMMGYLEKEPLGGELKEMKIDENLNRVEFVLMNTAEFTKKAIKVLFLGFKENTEGLIECLNNNYAEFKKFFLLVLPILESLAYNIKAFRVLADLTKSLGLELVALEPASTQMFFESIMLEPLLTLLKKYPNKYDALIPIFFNFCQNDSLSKLRLVKRIKEILQIDLNYFISILAHLVPLSCDNEMDEDFFNLYLYYSMIALEFANPITRANGLKIIAEITIINYNPILSFMKKFDKLKKDSWWEVKSQLLVISSNLLQCLMNEDPEQMVNENNSLLESKVEDEEKNLANPEENENEEEEDDENEDGVKIAQKPEVISKEEKMKQKRMEMIEKLRENKENNEKFLLDLIYEIFRTDSSNNILHIGLVYLSPILNHYPMLCDRYLEILIKISEKIRETVLNNPNSDIDVEEGYVVSGCKSFKYRLNGISLVWNSVGIVQSLDKYVKEKKLENFEKEHLQILAGCFVNKLEEKDSEVWVNIYENLKNHIFLALCDKELCLLAAAILKKIFTFEKIQGMVLKNSVKIFLKILILIYHPDTEEGCRQNLLQFFGYLNSESEIFKEYLYEIIKEFSEKNKVAFLKSNLVEFMNGIAKERRGKIFGNTYLNL